MTVYRLMLRSAPVAAILAASTVSFAQAPSLLIGQPRVLSQNGSALFEWSGQVDREVQIVMRGGRVWTDNVGQTEQPHARTRAFSVLPHEEGQVVVERLDGRGNVDVIQQPSRQNDYTTIIRVTDPRSGSDGYRLAAYWQAYANGDVYDRGRGRGRGHRDRDDDVYRRRDRDDDDRGGYDNGRSNNGVYNRGGQELLHWTGNVDGELEIRIQNGRVDYRTISGQQATNIRANTGYVDLRNGGTIGVSQAQGRGSVYVTQQPSQWNGYTTVIRIRDPQGGYGYYDFSLFRQ